MKISDLVKGKKTCRIAYIGGSITEGAGATRPENRWTSRLTAELGQRFPETAFEEINAGIGGTASTYGLLRLRRDVLRHAPDIVFVEFSLNDEALEEDLSAKAYEGILRALMQDENKPCAVLIGVVGNRAQKTRARMHAALGAHYGVKMIDLQAEMDALLGEADPGRNPLRDACFTADNVHPSDHGYAFYTERLLAHMEEDLFFRPSAEEKQNAGAFSGSGKFINAAALIKSGAWERCGEGDWNRENCGSHDAGVLSSDPDAALHLDFYGQTVVVGERIGTDFGELEITLDGETSVVDCYYPTVNQPVVWFERFEMPAGRHHLTIRPTGRKNEKSSRTAVKVDFVCVEAAGNGSYLVGQEG